MATKQFKVNAMDVLETIFSGLISDAIASKGEEVLKEHIDCLAKSIEEPLKAGMPADKIAEIAFVSGFVYGVAEVLDSKAESEE
ncbi:hypothetical protein [Lactococcus formosensis]|uniref:hypothetical protein n=1 Tax=Lactococcus formosensis TaxID=1281486 RepID=UPI002435B980|nr:hypothetical protein [Lactococcus formosensis]MDG6130802.1 hypothetical protein [Lactococcus formosensis]